MGDKMLVRVKNNYPCSLEIVFSHFVLGESKEA